MRSEGRAQELGTEETGVNRIFRAGHSLAPSASALPSAPSASSPSPPPPRQPGPQGRVGKESQMCWRQSEDSWAGDP